MAYLVSSENTTSQTPSQTTFLTTYEVQKHMKPKADFHFHNQSPNTRIVEKHDTVMYLVNKT